MSDEPEYWTCRHFSISNPRDDGSDDLPRLLRRVADQIEQYEIKSMDVLQLTVELEMTSDGPWWSATIFWQPDSEPADDAV